MRDRCGGPNNSTIPEGDANHWEEGDHSDANGASHPSGSWERKVPCPT